MRLVSGHPAICWAPNILKVAILGRDDPCVYRRSWGPNTPPRQTCQPRNYWTAATLAFFHILFPNNAIRLRPVLNFDPWKKRPLSSSILGQISLNSSQFSAANLYLAPYRDRYAQSYIGPWASTRMALIHWNNIIRPKISLDIDQLYPLPVALPILLILLHLKLRQQLLNRTGIQVHKSLICVLLALWVTIFRTLLRSNVTHFYNRPLYQPTVIKSLRHFLEVTEEVARCYNVPVLIPERFRRCLKLHPAEGSGKHTPRS